MRRRSIYRELKALADQYGFEYEGLTQRGHHIWRHRVTRRVVHTVSSPRDRRAIKNCERDFKGVTNGQHADAH